MKLHDKYFVCQSLILSNMLQLQINKYKYLKTRLKDMFDHLARIKLHCMWSLVTKVKNLTKVAKKTTYKLP